MKRAPSSAPSEDSASLYQGAARCLRPAHGGGIAGVDHVHTLYICIYTYTLGGGHVHTYRYIQGAYGLQYIWG